jgi:hypothetical protein
MKVMQRLEELTPLPSFENEEQFLKKISQDRFALPQNKKLKILKNEESLVSLTTAYCMKYYTLCEDPEAK